MRFDAPDGVLNRLTTRVETRWNEDAVVEERQLRPVRGAQGIEQCERGLLQMLERRPLDASARIEHEVHIQGIGLGEHGCDFLGHAVVAQVEVGGLEVADGFPAIGRQRVHAHQGDAGSEDRLLAGRDDDRAGEQSEDRGDRPAAHLTASFRSRSSRSPRWRDCPW